MERGAHPPADVDNKATHSSAVSSPETRQEASQMHRPPMSVVVVRKTPPSALPRPLQEPQSAPAAVGGLGLDDTEIAAERSPCLSSAGFRLQPRNPVCTPSPTSKAGSRGRKRSAQCLATTVPRSIFAKDETKPSVETTSSESNADEKSPPSFPPSLKDCAESGGSESSDCPGTPSRVQSALQSLSIRSPHITPRRPAHRPPGSSFILYSSSPVGSLYVRPKSNSSSSTGSNKMCMNSPSSSNKSSPKFAPLKVLQQSVVEDSTKTSTRRPPLHGKPSSMLYSLDGSGADSPRDEGPLRTPQQFPSSIQYLADCSNGSSITRDNSPGQPSTPSATMTPNAAVDADLQLQTPIAQTPQAQTPKAQTPPVQTPKAQTPKIHTPLAVVATPTNKPPFPVMDALSSRDKLHPSPRTPMQRSGRNKRSHRSPLIKLGSAPSSRHSRSPRTPLPKVTLTPRTPSSRGGLPTFPSPSDADIDIQSSNLLIGEPSQRPVFLAKSSKEGSRLAPFLPSSIPTPSSSHRGTPNLLSMSTDAGSIGNSNVKHAETKDSTLEFLPRPRKASYLPVPDWCEGGSGVTPTKSFLMPTTYTSPRSDEATPQRNNITHVGLEGTDFFGVKTKSLLTPSRSGGMLQAMMEQDDKAAAMDVDGSLTDTDDDEAFILAAPAALAEERQASSRARQRRRRSSYIGLDISGVAQSSNSLASSAQASSTSLFGMDIIHDTGSSSNRDTTTPISSVSSKLGSTDRLSAGSKENLVGQLGKQDETLQHVKSEGSLASIGLALEASSERKEEMSTRDLVTPPVEAEPSVAPPALSADRSHLDSTPNNTSICISSANPDAVNMTIARMAIQAHQIQSTHMECSG